MRNQLYEATAAVDDRLSLRRRKEVPAEEVRNLIGHGARALLRRGLAETGESNEALVEAAFPTLIDYYAANICVGTRAYPGVEQALDALKARGVRLAICTNKPERLTHLLLDALAWRGRFDAIVGGDTCGVRKPDPRPLHEAIARAGGGRGAFVGDSIVDADTARAAGVKLVAVSFGFSDRPVEALGADAVIDRYEDLIPTLERL
ncbi:MAG: HAD family hydrolase [Alphaproteobacteria bacterium]|nr:MAG: HAD family hydrolase [Alphaproteobacteria bacterium]